MDQKKLKIKLKNQKPDAGRKRSKKRSKSMMYSFVHEMTKNGKNSGVNRDEMSGHVEYSKIYSGLLDEDRPKTLTSTYVPKTMETKQNSVGEWKGEATSIIRLPCTSCGNIHLPEKVISHLDVYNKDFVK